MTDNLEHGTQAIMNHIEIPPQFRSITKQISNQTCSTEILRILQKNDSFDISVYAMGIRKCNTLNNASASLKILGIMKQDSIDRNASIYALLIHGLCHEDRLNEAYKLLTDMIMDGINPTNNAYTALLGGCRARKNVQLAEEIWHKMKNDEGISVDVIAYTVMISLYGKCGMTEQAEGLWSEFLDETSNEIDEAICCSMINVYSSQLMPSKAIEMIQFMRHHHIKLNITHYSSLIQCFLRMKSPKRALNIFSELRSNDIELNSIAFNQLCIAQYQLLQNELTSKEGIDMQNVQKYYDELMRLSVKYQKFLRMDRDKKWFGKIRFDAMVAMNENGVIVDDTMLIKEFEMMLADGYLDGYWTRGNNGKWMIDLHFHSKNTARFILRYVFEFERENLDRNVVVICGRSSHSLSITTEETMKTCIIKELLSWHPSIRAVVDPHNDGCLLLNADDVFHFLSTYSNLQSLRV